MPSSQNSPFTRIDTLSIQGTYVKTDSEPEFFIILQGELSAELNGQPFTAGSEDVMLVLPSDRFQLSGGGTNLVQLFKIKSGFFAQGRPEQPGFYLCNSALDQERDYTPLRRLLAQIALNAKYRSNVRLMKTMELAYALLHYLNTYHYVGGENSGRASKYETRTAVILSYLEMNYMNDISLEQLAKTVYLTPTYLSRFFKRHMGENFFDCLKKIRLRHAVEELLETDHKIIDVAISNGFSGGTVFNRAFQEVYHMSPGQYRQRFAAGESREIQRFAATPEAHILADHHLQLLSSAGSDEEEILYPSAARYTVKNAQRSRKIAPIWKQAINIGFIDTQNSALLLEQLRWAQRDIGFQYGRLEGVLTDHLMPRLPDGNYNFTYFDRHIEMLLSVGLTPYLDLSERPNFFFTPEIVYTRQGQGADRRNHPRGSYAEKVGALIKHCINIYGISQVEGWIFEIGHRHDEYLNPSETPREFAQRFHAAHRAIKSLLPGVQVGGIVYNTSLGSDYFLLLLDALEKQNVSPDFISVSIFPREFPSVSSSPRARDMTRLSADPNYTETQLRIIREALASRPFFRQRIFVASIGTDIQMRNLTNDTCYQGAFLAKVIAGLLDRVELMAYWQLTDLGIESPDVKRPLFGGSGLISTAGIPKPGYYVLKNFSQFREQLVDSGRNYLVCSNTVNAYSVVLFNYVPPKEPVYLEPDGQASPDAIYASFKDAPTEDVTLALENLPSGRYKVVVTAINRKNGSLLDSLTHYGVFEHIQAEDVEYLREMVHPSTTSHFEEIQNGHMEFHMQLLPHEVRFLKITRQL